MKKLCNRLLLLPVVVILVLPFFTGCSNSNRDAGVVLQPEPVECTEDEDGNNPCVNTQNATEHGIFHNTELGVPISQKSMGIIDPDPTGLTPSNDYDGDGILNDHEISSNPFVADYPRIVTRVTTPITMEIRVLDTTVSDNHTELLEESDTKNTLSNSMEDKHYTQLNTKTTPVGKKTDSSSEEHDENYSYETNKSISVSSSVKAPLCETTINASLSTKETESFADKFKKATNTEKTIFEDVDYNDNLDRNGIEFTDETVEKITRNARSSATLKNTQNIGSNAGYVRAGLFLKNPTVNMPVRISNIVCTLSFRTPAGEILPVSTFRLRYDDYTMYDIQIGGGEEVGPYTIELENLNTNEVKQALKNGYIPQITVVNYDMTRVADSNYNPGVDDLKMVEETAKGRTATIKVIGPEMRELYRVCAFEVDESTGYISPGVSLKRALFNIFRRQVGTPEVWDDAALTVPDANLAWKNGNTEHEFVDDEFEYKGNKWDEFETYIKEYSAIELDENGDIIAVKKKIETIRRIQDLAKYNPYNINDNPDYNASEEMDPDEILKMGYWVILHNGRYFDGDLNDPIWAGERYEIIYVEVSDFNEHFERYTYNPLQSLEPVTMSTRWNKLSNSEEFSRAVKLGSVIPGDVIKLEVECQESRSLFDSAYEGLEFGNYQIIYPLLGLSFFDYKYSFDDGEELPNGIPQSFEHQSWGGTNNLTVQITDSVNAHYYAVSFWPDGSDESAAKTVLITPDELQTNSNYFTISRKTADRNEQEVGKIESGTYNVRVRAFGQAYGVDVSTESGSIITIADVYAIDTGTIVSFSSSSSGGVNSLEVNINETSEAEHYVVSVKGPLNYGYDESSAPETLFTSQQGKNIFHVPTPKCSGGTVDLTEEERNYEVPGVYQVTVFAVNDNHYDGDELDLSSAKVSLNGVLYAMVSYEKYEQQKVYAPKKVTNLFTPKDLDLEVNFNDGSGWFRLKLAHNDIAEDERTIDCRYTSNFDDKEKKVVVYFTPPNGSENPQNNYYNVFRGGKEEVDVYIRTVAKPEYRDSIWIKPNTDSDFNDVTSRFTYINQQYTSYTIDNYSYWLNNPDTDATEIERYADTTDGLVYNNSADLEWVAIDSFGVCNIGGIDDLFFSPAKERTLQIKSSITEKDLQVVIDESQNNHVDNPSYRVVASDNKAVITELDAQYADSFDIYIREGEKQINDDSVDLSSSSVWKYLGNTDSTEFNIDDSISSDIVPLEPMSTYTLCIIANNSSSTSSRVFKTFYTLSGFTPITTMLAVPYNMDSYSGIPLYVNCRFMGGSADHPLTTNNGGVLSNGEHFLYGELLNSDPYDIYDDENSGDLLSGFFRIVNDGKNITDSEGLNLIPVAYDLTDLTAPHSTVDDISGDPQYYAYIDPATGRFSLPQPVYWNRCESGTVSNSSISVSQYDFTLCDPVIGSRYNQTYTFRRQSDNTAAQIRQTCMFLGSRYNKGLYVFNRGEKLGYYSRATIKPFGSNDTKPDLSSGALSLWCRVYGGYRDGDDCFRVESTVTVNLTDTIYVRFYDTVLSNRNHQATASIYSDDSTDSISISGSSIHHLLIFWDLVDGNITFYIDGNEYSYTTTATAGDISDFLQSIELLVYCFDGGDRPQPDDYTSASYASVDNIKIWSGVFDPQTLLEMEYGANRNEGAMHPIYGTTNGYKPMLDTSTYPDSGVGFHYLPGNSN